MKPLVLLLCFTLASVAAEADEAGTTPYLTLYQVLSPIAGIEAYDRLIAVERIESKLPAVHAEDIRIVIHAKGGDKAKDALPVETMVEVFEHPRAVSFDALDFGDLQGESGRLDLFRPKPTARLSDLTSSAAAAFDRVVDPAKMVKPYVATGD